MSDEGFLLDTWTAMLFFKVCKRFHVDHPEDRLLLMRELVKRQKAKYIRDVAPWMKGKRILKIRFKSKGDKQ